MTTHLKKRRSIYDKLSDPHGYKPAFANIDKLEQHVIRATIKVDFLLDDVVSWLFDRELIALCVAAYGQVASPHRREYNVELNTYGVHASTLTVNFEGLEMCMPAATRHRSLEDLDNGSEVPTLLHAYNATIKQFNEVRAVVSWLQKYATPAAARYYWPVIKGLLPPEHTVHEESGRYLEPKRHISEIMTQMRSASATVASALLCQREEEPEALTHVVLIEGGRTYGIL